MAQTALAEARVGAIEDAFERLYREHAATVYRYALGVLRNPADAEDIAQSTFTNAFKAIRRGEWPTKPENWLITIAHNECRQRFRRAGRRGIEVPLDDDIAERTASADTADTAAALEDVLNGLAELPFNQRTALVLREVCGRSAAEIAQVLGTSVGAVEMLIFRARRTLRTQRVGVLALVPLPRSLLSFGAGSAAAKAGAVAGGIGVAGKVAAVIVAGAVAAGAGYTGVQVKENREPAAKPPVRAERGPVEGVRENREVPPPTREAPVGEPAAERTPVPVPPVLLPPAAVEPTRIPAPTPESSAVPPVEAPPALPPPPEVAVPPLPPVPVEPPPVTVPPVTVPPVVTVPTAPVEVPVP